MEKELYKTRSISGCIKAGYVLFCSNFMTILRKNWLPLLALTMAGGLYMGWNISHLTNMSSAGIGLSSIMIYILLNLLQIGAMTWYAASTTNMLNQNGFSCNLRRNAKLMLFSVITLFLFAQLITLPMMLHGNFPVTNTTAAAPHLYSWIYPAWALVVFIGMAPFAYSSMKYIQEEKAGFTSHVVSGYKTGLRYIGFILSILFLYAVIIFFSALVVAMPLCILAMSNTISQMGVNNGDPNTLPSYFPILIYGTSILMYFIFTGFITVGIYINYYLYGSIEAKQQAHKNRKAIQIETQNK